MALYVIHSNDTIVINASSEKNVMHRLCEFYLRGKPSYNDKVYVFHITDSPLNSYQFIHFLRKYSNHRLSYNVQKLTKTDQFVSFGFDRENFSHFRGIDKMCSFLKKIGFVFSYDVVDVYDIIKIKVKPMDIYCSCVEDELFLSANEISDSKFEEIVNQVYREMAITLTGSSVTINVSIPENSMLVDDIYLVNDYHKQNKLKDTFEKHGFIPFQIMYIKGAPAYASFDGRVLFISPISKDKKEPIIFSDESIKKKNSKSSIVFHSEKYLDSLTKTYTDLEWSFRHMLDDPIIMSHEFHKLDSEQHYIFNLEYGIDTYCASFSPDYVYDHISRGCIVPLVKYIPYKHHSDVLTVLHETNVIKRLTPLPSFDKEKYVIQCGFLKIPKLKIKNIGSDINFHISYHHKQKMKSETV